MNAENGYRLMGLSLFTAYLIQHFLDLRWRALIELQQSEVYKIVSGLLLLLLILFQWYFSRVRANTKVSAQTSNRLYRWHIWLGALSPLLFYLHTAVPGYAYLFVLTVLFFANLLLGMANYDAVPIKKNWYFQSWMVLHISLSCLISALVLVHIAMVVYYE